VLLIDIDTGKHQINHHPRMPIALFLGQRHFLDAGRHLLLGYFPLSSFSVWTAFSRSLKRVLRSRILCRGSDRRIASLQALGSSELFKRTGVCPL
jgi:hypothetical protein